MFSIKQTTNVLSIGLLLAILIVENAHAKDWLVTSQSEFKSALQHVEPGDDIVLANGRWQDFEIDFVANGKADAPITLRSQDPGKVIITGQSNLQIGGEHLVVSGLYFTDGFTPSGEVISFRSGNTLANYSRVTGVVIYEFSNPNKFEEDKWVVLYGRNNRVDHNHFEGKRNKGVTMAVRLNTAASQQNKHRIDGNYFGPRPILGSNGGETLRIGTSKYSLTDSFTVVENNFFDRCNGEVEIISNKSGKNVFRNNTFFESRGTLTLRHGNGNIIEDNTFLGNYQDYTGGIRVINAEQTIRNNYLYGLTGHRFGGGLVILNGVPNSKINRYHQVKDSFIENNTLIGLSQINFAAGSDAERTAVPVNTTFKYNLIVNEPERGTQPTKINIFDDVSGMQITNNVANIDFPTTFDSSNKTQEIRLVETKNGLLTATNIEGIGAKASLKPLDKSQTGAKWFTKTEAAVAFDSGETHYVDDTPSLLDAIEAAQSGDAIVLRANDYPISRVISLNKVITLKGEERGSSVILPLRSTLFELSNGANLKLENLTLNGNEAPDAAGNVIIRHTPVPVINNYKIHIKDVTMMSLNTNHSYHVFNPGYRTFADSITIENSQFLDITGDILQLDKERDDLGIYNAEYVTLRNNEFNNIGGAIVKLYRGGTDESTFGPILNISNNTIEASGKGRRNKTNAAFFLHGVQVANIKNNGFDQSAPIHIDHTVGQPRTAITDNKFSETPPFVITELPQNQPDTAILSGNTYQ